MPENILIMMPFSDEYRAQTLLIAKGHTVHFVCTEAPRADLLSRADVIIGNPSESELGCCHNLKWLQTRTAGVDMYLKPGVLPHGCRLTSASGGYGTAISEYLLAVTLALHKQLHRYRDCQLRHEWQAATDIRCIKDSNVLVIGTGDIGSQYAKKINALGANVFGVRRTVAEVPEYFKKMVPLGEMDGLLPLADTIVLALPANKDSIGLFNAERFSKVKKGALLINVGRGSLVDTEALMDALDAGAIAGAALDVTDPEPLPASHPLWDYENVILTPHAAGGEYFGVIYDDTIRVCLSNLERYLLGQEPKNQATIA
jgi:Phosphoglycerate dehydrogenase and related dehydrogenases